MKFLGKLVLSTMIIFGSVGIKANIKVADAGVLHNGYCNSSVKRVVCVGPMQAGPTMYHKISETDNYTVYCSVVQMTGLHTVRCDGCDVLIKSESRICEEYHDKCGHFTSICRSNRYSND